MVGQSNLMHTVSKRDEEDQHISLCHLQPRLLSSPQGQTEMVWTCSVEGR